jgi:hypothetical protein
MSCRIDVKHVTLLHSSRPKSRNKVPNFNHHLSSVQVELFTTPLYFTVHKMAAAIKRTTLKLGMIPADGIGKEVIPVRLRFDVSFEDNVET